MKTNFKKTLAVLLAVLMITSVFGLTVFAAYTSTIQAGSADGSTLKATLEDGTPITDDMLSITTDASNYLYLPDEPYFEREDYIQDGWTKTASGAGTLLAFGSRQKISNNTTKFYPHWKQVTFNFIFNPGNNYDETDPNNFADAAMTQVKELVIKTDGTEQIILPGAMFTREGYEHTGWSTAKSNNGTGTKMEFGSVYNKAITKDVSLYPYWTPIVYDVRFEGGEYGVGTAQSFEVAYNKTVKAPGEIFTREGHTQIGWATVENSDVVELELSATSPKILGDTTYYPVWRRDIISSAPSVEDAKFGIVCIGYEAPAAQSVTITNDGTVPLEFTLPVSENYNITLTGGSLSLAAGRSFTISIQPRAGLAIADYAEELVIACDRAEANVTISASFKVVAHSFGKHKSNGDATYTADGTKSADCLNGCGTKDTIADPGSMKVYSADNNDAVGLASSYEHHRTVRFTAYGSGMDDREGVVGKRYVPVSWYVNDDFNGEFEEGYDVVFTHTIFGEYTLTINYVEEEFDVTAGEWVATGEIDTKTFDYTVGPTAEEEQEIIMPNTILGIIFALFMQLLSLLGIGG